MPPRLRPSAGEHVLEEDLSFGPASLLRDGPGKLMARAQAGWFIVAEQVGYSATSAGESLTCRDISVSLMPAGGHHSDLDQSGQVLAVHMAGSRREQGVQVRPERQVIGPVGVPVDIKATHGVDHDLDRRAPDERCAARPIGRVGEMTAVCVGDYWVDDNRALIGARSAEWPDLDKAERLESVQAILEALLWLRPSQRRRLCACVKQLVKVRRGEQSPGNGRGRGEA